MMNPIDRIAAFISPGWGYARMQSRARLALAARAFDAARKTARTSGWVAGSTSANGEIGPASATLRNRSRDLGRNNPYAAKTFATLVSSGIGTGIMAKLEEGQQWWDAWIEECDADGANDFYGLQALALRTMHESGECLVRLRYRRPSDDLAVPLQLQVLEPDYLDAMKSETLKNGGWIAGGIEYDAIGRRSAYWLFRTHPGDTTVPMRTMNSHRVPAADVIHLYEKTRPGQSRGVPVLAPSMMKMRTLDDYEEAELIRKAIEACYAAFVTTDEPPVMQADRTVADDGKRRQSVEAGMIEYLKPGESVSFGAPSPVQGYAEYLNVQLHAIAAGIGVTCEQMTGDLSRVNYSSIRAGTIEFRRGIEQRIWLTFIPVFCKPVMKAWKNAAFLSGRVDRTDFRVEWTAPRFEYVDPVKDAQGDQMEVAAGMKTWSELVRERGYDPEATLRELQAEQRKFAELGIRIKIQDLIFGRQEAGA
ncbi:MAG: phage portal protein [Burkholderiales bacterium]